MVAGGSNKDSVDISSTETLVEGGTTWNFQKPLPSERKALRGVSLVDTVIMTGKKLKLTVCLKKTPLKEMCDFLTLKMLPLALALIGG